MKPEVTLTMEGVRRSSQFGDHAQRLDRTVRQFETLHHCRVSPAGDATYRKIDAYAVSYCNVGKNSQAAVIVLPSCPNVAGQEPQVPHREQFATNVRWLRTNAAVAVLNPRAFAVRTFCASHASRQLFLIRMVLSFPQTFRTSTVTTVRIIRKSLIELFGATGELTASAR
ncbi:MAG: hypothetical protein GY903_18690 [Fuerstiella sp.]|nr:hypothetical protein [Fuerstiella sp.]MCP4785169.1 hypothetical protein [Fuerstiella sp.]MCP4856513.1 hypothetical protein [Fuerstiella sp.]